MDSVIDSVMDEDEVKKFFGSDVLGYFFEVEERKELVDGWVEVVWD